MLGRLPHGRGFWFGMTLVLATLLAYAPVVRNELINYDDPQYITSNPHVARGLTGENVCWAWTTFYAANWHPLTWLSLQLDVQLWGRRPGGLHVMNVLLHAANVLLLFGWLSRLTGQTGRSALVAALFALHPLHVQSVVWATERKDVLSTLFWLLSMWAYAFYAARPNGARYGLVVLAFAMGLLAKPMLVTLPFVLLLLDYWPLGRLHLPGTEVKCPAVSWRWLVLEKVPLLALAVASCVVTVVAQHSGGAVYGLARLTIGGRLANALSGYGWYLAKTAWPADLAAYYPHPWEEWSGLAVLGSVVVLGLVSTALLWKWRRPWLVVGWLWFLGTLLPVIGLVQVGDQAVADRYTYVPHIGLFVVLVWGSAEVLDRLRWPMRWQVGLASSVLVLLSACTWTEVGHWQDSKTLWTHALAVAAPNSNAYYLLGNAQLESGNVEEAIASLNMALKLPQASDPLLAGRSHGLLGIAHAVRGEDETAIAHLLRAAELFQGLDRQLATLAQYHLGLAYRRRGQSAAALAAFRAAVENGPEFAPAHLELGNELIGRKLFREAETECLVAVQQSPDNAEAHNRLGVALAGQGQSERALRSFDEAIHLGPELKMAHVNRGALLSGLGRLDEAAADYQTALQLNPKSAVVWNRLGLLRA